MTAPLRSTQPDTPQEARILPGLLSSSRLREIFKISLDLLFPPRCAGCSRVDTIWCAACQNEIDAIEYPPLKDFNDDSPLRCIAATGTHEGKLQQTVLALKFEDQPELAITLGQRLSTRLETLEWTIDMLVSVPLHTNRFRQRGYNQSQLIGEQVAELQSIPIVPDAITRELDTRSQVGLDARQRQQNMQDAFIVKPNLVQNRNILLIDDVYTTGATMTACARAAMEAGAASVYGLTVTMA